MLTLRKKLKSAFLILIAIFLLTANLTAKAGRSRSESRNSQRSESKRTTSQRTKSRARRREIKTVTKKHTTIRPSASNRSRSAARSKSVTRSVHKSAPRRSRPVRKAVSRHANQPKRRAPAQKPRSVRRSITKVRNNITRTVIKPQKLRSGSGSKVTTVRKSTPKVKMRTRSNTVKRSTPTVRTKNRTTTVKRSAPKARTKTTRRVTKAKPAPRMVPGRKEITKRITTAKVSRKTTRTKTTTTIKPKKGRQVFVSTKKHTKMVPAEKGKRPGVVKRTKKVTTKTVDRGRNRIPSTKKSTTVVTKTRTRPNVNRRSKTDSKIFPKRSSSRIDRDKTIPNRKSVRSNKSLREIGRRNSNVRVNKNITTNNHVLKKGRNRAHRPVIKTRTHKRSNRIGKHHNRGHHKRNGRNDVKIVKHIHFHKQRHGRHPNKIFSRIVWPHYKHRIYYNWHGHRVCRYYRPYYHRKYVFVSFGGYWPSYRYVRYYRYGWHPYKWYGSYPTAYEVSSPTYNYYTYNSNYYSTGSTETYSTTGTVSSGNYYSSLPAVNNTTFEDVREKLAVQAEAQPDGETLVDKFFADGVEAFENEDYETAAEEFADAIALEPNDVVLPFAYVQALFATEQYSKAADILRLGLEAMPVDQQGLFFPRGLYKEDKILLDQIERLRIRAETFSYDLDLALLLGYQYLGIEEYDRSRKWLNEANRYEYNTDSATLLIKLLDMLQEQQASADI